VVLICISCNFPFPSFSSPVASNKNVGTNFDRGESREVSKCREGGNRVDVREMEYLQE